MPLSEIFPAEREAPEEHLSASVRQLEALTALAAAPAGDGRALEELFAGLADTITNLTDYRTCLVVLFDEDGRTRRVVSHSPNIPAEYVAQAGERPYPRAEVARLVERGLRIDVGGMGYAAYYPPSHHHQLAARQRDAAKLAAQAEREALVNRITRAVRQSLDADEVFRAATRELGVQLAVDRCAVFMLDRAAGVVRTQAVYTAPGVAPAAGEYPLPLVNNLVQAIRH